MKIKEVKKVLSSKEVELLVKNESISKSKKIIELFNGGLECKEISLLLGIRYNFSYNVIFNYCNVNKVEKEVSERKRNNGEVKNKIIDMYNNGSSKVEICKILCLNYNYVGKICNESLNK